MWRRATLDFAEARRLPPRSAPEIYSIFRREAPAPWSASEIYTIFRREAPAPGLSPKILLYEEKDEKGAEAISSHSWDV